MPGSVSFDDLIPAGSVGASNGPVSFDDLIPRSEGYRGALIPRKRDAETGETSWAVPRVLDPFITAVNAPGEAYRGEFQVMDEQGNVTPEALHRAAATAVAFPSASAGLMRPRPSAAGTPVRVTRRVETPLQAASRRQQVTMPRAAATESPTVANVARRVADLPGIGQPLRSASQRTMRESGEALGRVVDDLGRGDVVSAGTGVTDDITRFAGRGQGSTLSQRTSALYKEVDGLVDDAISSPLRATTRAVDGIIRQRQRAAISGTSAAVREVQPALQRGALTYSGIKGLRSHFGELLENPQALVQAGMNSKEASRIYAGLSDDLRVAVSRGGGAQATRAFERANRYARLASREREALQAILGRGADRSPENIVSRIERFAGTTGAADIASLSRVRRAVSRETWDDFASAVLARMGRNPKTGDFSGDRFLTAWGRMSDRARNILYPNATVRQSLDDLVTISRRFSELERLGNHSNTGGVTAITAAFGAGIVAPMQTLLAMIPPAAFAFIMSRPTSARQVVLWARAYEQAVLRPSAQASRVLTQRSQPLAMILSRELGAPDAVMQLAASLENVPTYAERQNEPQGVDTQNR